MLFSHYLLFSMLRLEKQCAKIFVVYKQMRRPTIQQNIHFSVSLNLENSDLTRFEELLMFAINDTQYYPCYPDKKCGHHPLFSTSSHKSVSLLPSQHTLLHLVLLFYFHYHHSDWILITSCLTTPTAFQAPWLLTPFL